MECIFEQDATDISDLYVEGSDYTAEYCYAIDTWITNMEFKEPNQTLLPVQYEQYRYISSVFNVPTHCKRVLNGYVLGGILLFLHTKNNQNVTYEYLPREIIVSLEETLFSTPYTTMEEFYERYMRILPILYEVCKWAYELEDTDVSTMLQVVEH